MRILNFEQDGVAAKIEGSRRSARGILSEYGWVFLINDSNQFLQYLYGERAWTEQQLNRAIGVLDTRVSELHSAGISYFKVIIPEKAVVYREYLPKLLNEIKQSDSRPAMQVKKARPEFVMYLDDYLSDAKSYGPLFFRGDTHMTWMGAYLAYRFAIVKAQEYLGNRISLPIPLGNLVPSIYGFEGDVYTQLGEQDRSILGDQWSDMQFKGAFEFGVKYELPLDRRRAASASLTGELAAMKFSRELVIREIDDPTLPRAVIFRDSTADFMVDLLAEHFRRTVFIWHRGEVVKDVLDLERPDIVIHFMAERFITSYGIDMVPLSHFSPD